MFRLVLVFALSKCDWTCQSVSRKEGKAPLGPQQALQEQLNLHPGHLFI